MDEIVDNLISRYRVLLSDKEETLSTQETILVCSEIQSLEGIKQEFNTIALRLEYLQTKTSDD